MNIYNSTATCNVCGGQGPATLKTATSQWIVGSFVSHTDPRVCAANIKREKDKLSKK